MARPETLLFDFGGTLDSNGTTWLERFHALYAELGIRTTHERFSRAFHDADDGLASRFPMRGLDLERTLALQVRCVLETIAPGRQDAAPEIVSRFVDESRRSLVRAREVLQRLAGRCRLGIVSNFYGNLESVLAGEGLRDLFGVVADSGSLGILKPDSRLFLHALTALGARPGDAWMIGDSVERDMRGAEALGMAHAWLKGRREAASACCPEARVLGSLGELEALLDGASEAELSPSMLASPRGRLATS